MGFRVGLGMTNDEGAASTARSEGLCRLEGKDRVAGLHQGLDAGRNVGRGRGVGREGKASD
ncbi:hypothetical protein GCM10009552_33730 [Rothia nasimurium]